MHPSRDVQGRGYGAGRGEEEGSEQRNRGEQFRRGGGGVGGGYGAGSRSGRGGQRRGGGEGRARSWSQDWRSADAGGRIIDSGSSYNYGGRRGEDQGGGGPWGRRSWGDRGPPNPSFGYGGRRQDPQQSSAYSSSPFLQGEGPESAGYGGRAARRGAQRRNFDADRTAGMDVVAESSGHGSFSSSSSSSSYHTRLPAPTAPYPGTPAHSVGDIGPRSRGETSSLPLVLPAKAPVRGTTPRITEAGSSSKAAERTAVSSSALSTLKLVAPSRPGPGREGKPIQVEANHFKVIFHPGDNIYQYDVDITPKISSKCVARMLERQLTDTYRSDFNGKQPAYDGSKCMYTHGPLPFQHREFVVILAEDKGTSGREKKFTVSIRHVSTLNRNNLLEFLKGKQVPTPQEHLQALDVLLREHPALHFISVSRSFFKKELGSAMLEGGLVAINGFYQSLRPTQDGLKLNVDLSTTAFHDSIPVIDFLDSQFKGFDPRHRLSDLVHMKVKKALARLKVQVIHRQTPRRYRISGLSAVPTKDLKFPVEGGKEMRVIDYFKATYNCIIEYPELPCLQVQANKLSYLPMEVCVICDGQKYAGKLNDRQTKDLRRLACVLPDKRKNRICTIMDKPDGPGRGDHVQDFGVQVVPELTTVNARLLPPPKLRYGHQGKVTEITPSNGTWNLLNSCVVEGGNVTYWALISFDQNFKHNSAREFVSSLSRRCNELGVTMAEQTIIPPLLCRREDLESPRLEKYLRRVHDDASQAIYNASGGQTSQLQLLVCVMAEKHHAYGELKRICETQIGIVTQCCLSKHVTQWRSQYLANLALKVNAKVGGRNVTLADELPRMCSVFNRPTIIFGADVTHPSPGDDSGPSIAAVVANIDWPSANKYVARARSQTHREEIIENLQEMVEELWHEFCEKTGSRPDRVIMFRDGVSEGQFDEVLQKEVVALKDAFEEVGGSDYKPLITWMIVQKRHHTRLFPADNNKDKNNNILPGTVVDSTITHPREFDFFLCSHAGIQGTSRPTHYHVLWDENNFKSDDLQGLVYNLCYTYARCTRAVSVVPPAYYAHLAAYRARLYNDSTSGSDTSLRGGSDSMSYRSTRFGTSSSSGVGSTRTSAPVVRPLPRVQRNVQEVMYFC